MEPVNYEYTLGDTLLEAKDVSLTLGGRQILKGVHATIRDIRRPGVAQGQVVGFLGPSGVGKTQFFRILAGLNEPTSGYAYVGGSTEHVKAGDVGVVAQHYPLFEHHTVLANLLIAGRQGGLKKAEARKKAGDLLRHFGLADRGGAWPAELSGGQRQRVAIAQQLMCNDTFLLMDEPFSGLDPVMKDRTCQLIRDVASMNERMTIIVVTHDIGSAIEVADTLWLLGRDRNANGDPIDGASIKGQIDLIARGLVWRDDIAELPQFAECVREVRKLFNAL